MSTRPSDSPTSQIDRWRDYLAALGRARVKRSLGDRIDLSGVIQQTVLEAYREAASFAGNDEQQCAWLRRIFASNLADALRAARAAKRDICREQPHSGIPDDASRPGMESIVSASPSPSLRLRMQERASAVAEALMRLPESQREALILQHWQDRPVREIATLMGRSPEAVAGLLKRGLRQLREQLAPTERVRGDQS